MRITITAIAVALAGCATPSHVPNWAHPAFAGSPERHEDAATISLAECHQTARSTIQMPEAPKYIPAPAPASYETTGTYSTYGGVGVLNATTRPRGGFSAGFASGANMGAAIGHSKAVNDANKHIVAITSACMRMRGWIDVSTPEGQERFRAASTHSSGAFDDLPNASK